MGFNRFVLLAVAVLLASADPVAASKELLVTAADPLTHGLQDNAPTKRLLRVFTTNGDDEERGISLKIPDTVSNVFKSPKTKQLEGLLKADDTLPDAFKKLKLSTMPVGKNNFIETDMVAKLLSSSNFKVWAKHAAQVNKKDPAGAMVASLRNVFDDKTLATMFMLGKLRWSSKSVATKMEKVLFKAWYKEGKRADGVLENMFGVKIGEIQGHPRAMAVWGDYSDYVKKRVFDYARGK